MRTYELVFIVQPELDEEALGGLVESVLQVISNNGGKIVHVEDMGRRRLAYPIAHQIDGFYVLVHAEMEQATITELERYIRLSEDILRHLLIRLEPAKPKEEEVEA